MEGMGGGGGAGAEYVGPGGGGGTCGDGNKIVACTEQMRCSL